jgi:hypothetical protein
VQLVDQKGEGSSLMKLADMLGCTIEESEWD